MTEITSFYAMIAAAAAFYFAYKACR